VPFGDGFAIRALSKQSIHMRVLKEERAAQNRGVYTRHHTADLGVVYEIPWRRAAWPELYCVFAEVNISILRLPQKYTHTTPLTIRLSFSCCYVQDIFLCPVWRRNYFYLHPFANYSRRLRNVEVLYFCHTATKNTIFDLGINYFLTSFVIQFNRGH
jgi:hypothetical protein